MLQNSWLKIEDKAYDLITPLLLIYIFFQPFNHFAGIRNSAFYAMLLLFLIKITRRGIKANWKDSAIVALFILTAGILLSIFLSNYLADSMNAFRKNFFNQVAVFFAILTEFRTEEKLKKLFYTIISSFIAVTLIIFIKNPSDALFNILEAKKHKESFLGGYALNAAFYIPFTLGYLFSIKNRITVRGFFWIMLLAEFVLVWLYYSSRTTLIAILISAVIMILLSKRYKMLAVILAVILGAGVATYFKKPELFERYKSLVSFRTYTTSVGLSGRDYIWSGAIDMIKARPIVGYGYGWKKITTVAREEGYLDRWKETQPATYDFYNSGYGKASPHNLALQMMFEIGILGVSAFALFWITVFIKVARIMTLRQAHDDNVVLSLSNHELNHFVKYGVIGVLTAYLIVNITNSLWEETYGILTFTLAAITMVIYDQNKCKGN